MKLIIFILNQEERLQEILEAFLELGINGATILDSIGMGRILAHDIPIFAGFQNLLHDTHERIIQAIEQIIGSLDDPGNGVFITMPIDHVKGYKEL
ncbi:MAG: hypothetical protein P8Y99_18970 [Calditrichaceae bacterium]